MELLVQNNDYYPFGMLMPNRHKSSGKYRYGFNGMEKDDEVKGKGNSYTTQFRGYDPRVARWISLDPFMAKYPHQSAYAGFNNNPIFYDDPTGLEGNPPGDDKTKPKTHKVKKGDTYTSIAKAYDVSVQDLQGWNDWNDTEIPVGGDMIVSNPNPSVPNIPNYEAADQSFSADLYSSDVTVSGLVSDSAGVMFFDVPKDVPVWEAGKRVWVFSNQAGVQISVPSIDIDFQSGTINFKKILNSSVTTTIEKANTVQNETQVFCVVATVTKSEYFDSELFGISVGTSMFWAPFGVAEYKSQLATVNATTKKLDSTAQSYGILQYDKTNPDALDYERKHPETLEYHHQKFLEKQSK